MNIPEGWKLVPIKPTDEMAMAGIRAHRYSPGAINGVPQYLAMLEAAPTPPAQEDDPMCPGSNITMAECILAGECGCTVKGHEFAQAKAQEDEPVYQLLRKKGWDWDTVSLQEYERAKAMVMAGRRILYTRPANDKLRKVAEEVLKILRLHGENDYADCLRAALKGE